MVLELGITPLIIRVIRVTADSSSKILSDQGHPRKYTCSTRFGCMQARQNVTTNARGLIGRGGRGRVESKGKEVGARRGGRESSFQKMGQTRSRLGRKRRGVISFRLSVVSQAAASLRWLASSTVRHTVELVRHWTTDVAASPSSFHTPPENFQRGPFSLLVSRHRRGRDPSCSVTASTSASSSYLCQCSRAGAPVAHSARGCRSNSRSYDSCSSCPSSNRSSNRDTERSAARGRSAPRNRRGRRSSTGPACCTPSTSYRPPFDLVTCLSEYQPPSSPFFLYCFCIYFSLQLQNL